MGRQELDDGRFDMAQGLIVVKPFDFARIYECCTARLVQALHEVMALEFLGRLFADVDQLEETPPIVPIEGQEYVALRIEGRRHVSAPGGTDARASSTAMRTKADRDAAAARTCRNDDHPLRTVRPPLVADIVFAG